jgi:DNA replication and repair protein RecF
VDGAATARDRLLRLRLTDFRNHAALDIRPEGATVVLTGENGAGKTNLLEAISLLAPGRGLRRAPYEEMARAGGTSGFAVHAVLDGPFGEAEIGTGVALSGETGGSRRVRINGATARTSEVLLEWIRVVWLTPAMDALFTGPAADRRRFLDRLVLAMDPNHGARALAYEKAMRGRNRLLAEDRRDDRWFEAIEAQMAEAGVAIAAARLELVRLLSSAIDRMPADGPFPQADVMLAGRLEESLAVTTATDAEEAFRSALAEGRARDRAARRTLEGPHRSDLAVAHRPKATPAALCSTGEQKALLVGIVLAHARLSAEISGHVPVVLLDEIAAHLDARRRRALFAILDEIGCQTFMTGTDASLFEDLRGRARFFAVAGGGMVSEVGESPPDP